MNNFEDLDQRFAYPNKSGLPIRAIEQIPTNKLMLLITNFPDPEWQDRIDYFSWWSHKNIREYILKRLNSNQDTDPRFLELHDTLLEFGGYETCFPIKESDMTDILERGQLWIGDCAVLMEGEPSRCHANATRLWETNRNSTKFKVAIATGYALSDDGLWRQHTWLVQHTKTSLRIVETTAKRTAYFGFVMTDDEAKLFAEKN